MQWTLINLITTSHDVQSSDVKAIMDFHLPESDKNKDLSAYDESRTHNSTVVTNIDVASIIVKPSSSGRLKYLVLKTNNSTFGMNEDNDPTSFQLYGQCDAGHPLEEITTERRTNLPAERGFEKWYRIAGNKDFKYYVLVFKNKKGNPMEIEF